VTDERNTRLDRLLAWIENNKLAAAAIVFSMGVVGLSAFTDALANLYSKLHGAGSHLTLADLRVYDRDTAIATFKKTWFSLDTARFLRDSLDALAPGDSSTKLPQFAVLGEFPVIDLLFRNAGSDTELLTRLELRIRRTRATPDVGIKFCSPFGPTWAYHLLVDGDQPEQHLAAHLSQAVPSHGADRFVLVVGHEGRIVEAEYEIDGKVYYGENRYLNLPPFHVRIKTPPCGAGPQLRKPRPLPPTGLGRGPERG
jgi:hypothetical protein